jgi:hypothetical protein
MLKIRDRLYGELDLPEEAWRLASSCPVLLRLREIRMANIPFFSYPSFAHVDRFEHSLGVAHLAWRWAQRNRLADDLALALTLAALYHDGATPALGHLFEEYLFRYKWDHEAALFRLLVGDEQLPGGTQAQIFLDGYCKLGDVLSRSSYARTVTPLRVADIAAGVGEVGRLIKGDVDLDNIDNVLRASSAMGLADSRSMPHPYEVADALVLEEGSVRIKRDGYPALAGWSASRHLLYDHILNNAFEFRAQAAFKWAIDVCAQSDRELQSVQSWRLTDPELVFEHLRRDPFGAALVDRVRGGKPPELLFTAWVNDLGPLIGPRGQDVIGTLSQLLEETTGMKVYVNYYVDKRQRHVRLEPSQEPVLFETPATLADPKIGRLQAGILGVVAMTQAEFVGAKAITTLEADVAGAKRAFKRESLQDILQRVLQQEVPLIAVQGWIGSHEATEQLQLFAATE